MYEDNPEKYAFSALLIAFLTIALLTLQIISNDYGLKEGLDSLLPALGGMMLSGATLWWHRMTAGRVEFFRITFFWPIALCMVWVSIFDLLVFWGTQPGTIYTPAEVSWYASSIVFGLGIATILLVGYWVSLLRPLHR